MKVRGKIVFILICLTSWNLCWDSFESEVICSETRSNDSAGSQLDLTLEQAIHIALKDNRTLLDQSFTLSDRSISLDSSKDYFDIKIQPLSSINYSAGDESDITVWEVGGAISKRFKTGVGVELRPSVARGDVDYDAGIGFLINVPLLKGFGTEVVKDNIYSNEFALATSYRDVHRQRVNIMLDTISSVYLNVREQQLIHLYNEQISQLKKHLSLTRIKEKAGLALSMDVYRVDIRIKEVEDSLSLAQERVENISDQLKTILALPMADSLRIEAPLSYSLIAINLDDAVSVALKKRIEVQQGMADISEAVRKAKVAKLNILPELNLEATYMRRGRSSDFNDLLIFDQDVFRIGFTSNTDFSRSTEKSQWSQSKIVVNRQRLQFETVKDSIIRELRKVINSLEKSEERIQLRREQIAQATGKQKLAYVKFQHGKADNFDLIESQTQLQRAQANLVSEEIQYIISGYRLRAAMGTLLEYKGI